MTSPSATDTGDLLRRAYREIKRLRSRLAEDAGAGRAPIAVVGMACRFPGGASDPERFWGVLRDGVDAVTEVPGDRWDVDRLYHADPDEPGKLCTRHGSFLEHIDRFDAGLFGISPVEAISMDPQQRLLLEVAWEALESAGLAPDRLSASQTGVFVGMMYQDYLTAQLRDGTFEDIGPYLGTGTTFSAAAGRLSYVLGLQGPSLAVDTACSSSLVTVHLACQSLRQGECDVALAGGVNVMLAPEPTIQLSKAHMMSPSGRCRTFDAGADGYTRGEGCGLLVLKSLSQAARDGDAILGVIRGSAVNQDGRSNGFTAPSGSAQRALLHQALHAAGAVPEDVGYVECHGTGTPLGDPIEVGALAQVYGRRPADRPLAIGSVKTNFGHLESAAGVCGLIKALLVLRHRAIPPHLHLTRLNPHLRLEGQPIVIPTTLTPWFEHGPKLAAVSSFGFVGTNAHIVLEAWDDPPLAPQSPPQSQSPSPPPRGVELLALSGASEAALEAKCERFTAYLASRPGAALHDICTAANAGHAHLAHRVAVLATSCDEAARSLRARSEGGQPPALTRGVAPREKHPGPVFLFTGQGSQYCGAGQALYRAEPVFRETLDRCDGLLREHLGRSLLDLLFAGADSEAARLLQQTRYTQPALFALEYALFRQWTAWGVEPAVMLGHSIGEYVAACAAGIFELDDALRLVAARGRLMQSLPSDGAMAAVFAPETWVADAIAPYPETLSVAAFNSHDEIVLSGRREHLRAVLDRARGDGRHVVELKVSHAFHSPLMRPMLAPFGEELASVAFDRPGRALISNVSGTLVTGDELSTPQYWLDHVTAPVQFCRAVETLAARGERLLLEVGPRPTLTGLAARMLDGADPQASDGRRAHPGAGNGAARPAPRPLRCLASLQPDRDDLEQMLGALAGLYVSGVRIDWAARGRPRTGPRPVLPAYPFQRERYWRTDRAPDRALARARAGASEHLLGARLPQTAMGPDTVAWDVDVHRKRHDYLWQHKVLGEFVWPVSAHIELALAAARDALGGAQIRIESLEFQQTLYASDPGAQEVQAVLIENAGGGGEFRLYSRAVPKEGHDEGAAGGTREWTLNTRARLELESGPAPTADPGPRAPRIPAAPASRPLDFSMMFFAATEDQDSRDRYQLIIEAARHADREGYRSVWVPERHFTHMGSLYPNPSVLHAALARETRNVRLMAGSVVVPLHNPVRIAEEWAMVDNLSGGRVGLSLASGWNPDDFVLATGAYADRYDSLYEGVETLRRLWRGEAFEAEGVPGKKALLRTYPTPIQKDLPLWITAARSPESFRRAGAIGANLLTHLLDQDIETLAEKILLYRQARAENGLDPHGGVVTVMCHTFVAPDIDTVHRLARKPFCDYLKSSKPLLAGLAYSRDTPIDLDQISDAEMDEFVSFLYERFCGTRALIGTPDGCMEMLARMHDAGVGEIACLLDFGPTTRQVLEHLPVLDRLRRKHLARAPAKPLDAAARMPCAAAASPRGSLAAIAARCTDAVAPDAFYRTLAAQGVEFEGRLQGIVRIARGVNEVLAEVRSPGAAGAAPGPYVIHPVLLDACLQSALAALPGYDTEAPGTRRLRVPTRVARMRVYQSIPAGTVHSHGRVSEAAADGSLDADITVFADDGSVLFDLEGVHVVSVHAEPPATADTGEWLYEVAWRPRDWPRRRDGSSGRTWLVLEDACGYGAAWAGQDAGNVHLAVRIGNESRRDGPGRWILDPDAPDAFGWLLEQIDLEACAGIACLWALDAAGPGDLDVARLEADQRLGAEAVVALTRALAHALARTRMAAPPALWLVTCGAQPVVHGTDALEVGQSALWGIAAALAREHPEFWGGIVDLDPAAPVSEAAASMDRALHAAGREDQVAVRASRYYVRRLLRASPDAAGPAAGAPHRVVLRADAAYLICGGLGGLGLQVAERLAERGARHLILLSRTPMPADAHPRNTDAGDAPAHAPVHAPAPGLAGAGAAIAALERRGVQVTCAALDIADEQQVASFLADFARRDGAPPVRGVVHAAGVFRDRSLLDLDRAGLWDVLRAKVLGTWVLHRQLPADLDFFVLFSSFSALTPPPGQANYAAASAFLDAVAHLRSRLGRPALSINWGAWSGAGFAATKEGAEAHARLEAMGMQRIAPGQGLDVLERLLQAPGPAQIGVFPMNVRTMAEADPALAGTPLLAELDAGVDAAPASESAAVLHRALQDKTETEQRGILVDRVSRIVADVLQLPPANLAVDEPLTHLGLDSLIAVQVQNRVRRDLGHALPIVEILQGSSVVGLAETLLVSARMRMLHAPHRLPVDATGPHTELEL